MKSAGGIAFDAFHNSKISWPHCAYQHSDWERAAQAVLSSQWRPVSEPPEDAGQYVVTFGGGTWPNCNRFDCRPGSATHWLVLPPLPTPPEPTPEEKERKEFEEWATSRPNAQGYNIERDKRGEYVSTRAYEAWEGWQAARKSKQP